ncbi:MAG: dienelactone hydrolase family protein [Candidatus Kapabacteria bacterium]|jgi:carboxymethylenebutenolidase|nr:dienelactone hydrolase family protein [Candidatus Kapabacteria bacterium]
MNQEIINLYDEYTHTPLDRRTFLTRLAELAGGLSAAMALVPLLEANQAHAAQLAPDDTRLETARAVFPGGTGEVKAYTAAPKGASKLATVLVIHENRGLNPHIEDVTRRIALEGFFAIAPDLLSPLGGTPQNEDAARELIGKLVLADTMKNLAAAIAHFGKDARSNGNVGAMGFCWGGGTVGELAVNSPNLKAGVVYYGRQPKVGIEAISAPLLLHYAGLDARVNEGIPAFEEALKKAGKKYTLHTYEGVNHAFNNDTSQARYNKEAAETAWKRTVAFLKEQLRA